MLLRTTTLAVSLVLINLVSVFAVSNASADTRTTSDYIALVFEAESYDELDERWILTQPGTPAQENDPDPNHTDGAGGSTYLELLPDMRVTHADEFGPPTAIWNVPGTGPKASYPVDFPEAGRYYVHLRAYSTGTEDNGIHVGLNNVWPGSGARLQFCTAGQGWQWSGRQRDSGGAGACGAQKTVWVTVEEPGINTFMISAREDGFEVDRIMLIKDLSDNTRICKPANTDDISCVNGSLENTDEIVDMAVTIESDISTTEISETVEFSVVVENRDGYDSARDVVLELDLQVGSLWDIVSKDDDLCEVDNAGKVQCSLGTVSPSGAENEDVLDFELQPLRSGALPIPVSINTSSVDDSQSNDAAQVTVDVTDVGTLSQLTVNWDASSISAVVDTESTVGATVRNIGVADATQVNLTLSIPGGLAVTTLPTACSDQDEIQCSFESMGTEQEESLLFGLTPDSSGVFSANILATASNLDGDDASASVMLDVAEEPEPDTSKSGSMGLLFLLLMASTLWFKTQTVSQYLGRPRLSNQRC